MNGGAFYYDYRNKQLRAKIVDGIFGLLDGLVNVPKSKVKGAELELTVRPAHGLTLSVAGTYLDAKVETFNGIVASAVDPQTGLRVPVRQSYSGARLPYSPKWQGVANVEYQAPLTATTEVFVGANVSAQTKTTAVLAITATDKTDFALNGHALVGVNGGVQAADGRWRAMVWGKNIFNKYYIVNTILDYDSIGRYTGRAAEYGVTVGFKF